MKKTTIKDYYLKFAWLFLIGIIANIIVDITQTTVPEFLGDIVAVVSSKPDVVFNDIAPIITKIMIASVILFVKWRAMVTKYE